MVLCCISSPFGELSTTRGEMIYVLLTRAPLYRGRSPFSCDLHVLGAPLTFVLSQNQTLQFEFFGEPQSLSKPTAAIMLAIILSPSRCRLVRDEHLWCGDHAISRGVLGLSFQGPRGAGAPGSGVAVSSSVRLCCPEIFLEPFDFLFVRYSD